MSSLLRHDGSATARSRLPRFAEGAVARARLGVVPRLRSRAPRVPFVTLISLLLLAGVVGLLLFNTSMQQASFSATRLEDQATNLAAREQALQMDLDRLRDPQRLATLARRQGLVPAPAAAFIDADTGQVTGVPTPASPENDLTIDPPAPSRPPGLDPAPIIRQTQTPDRPGRPAGAQRDAQRDGQRDTQRDGQAATDRQGGAQAEPVGGRGRTTDGADR